MEFAARAAVGTLVNIVLAEPSLSIWWRFPYLGLRCFYTTAEINALRDILLHHVMPGQVLDSDLTAGSVAKVFTGNFITVVASGNTSVIRDTRTNIAYAGITATNILATNGVAHIINQV